jgi:serine/threonine protein kinase
MAKLRHPNIVPFYGMTAESPYYIVMHYMPYGALDNYLTATLEDPAAVNWRVNYKLALDIARGLHCLHQKEIYHCDLKSGNVLLDDNFTARLADFGAAKEFKLDNEDSGLVVGTPEFCAPEIIIHKQPASKENDVFSLGVVLWQLASRQYPFDDGSPFRLKKMIDKYSNHERLPLDEQWPVKWRKLMNQCWQDNPKKRPTALAVCEILVAEVKKKPATVSDIDGAKRVTETIISKKISHSQAATLKNTSDSEAIGATIYPYAGHYTVRGNMLAKSLNKAINSQANDNSPTKLSTSQQRTLEKFGNSNFIKTI